MVDCSAFQTSCCIAVACTYLCVSGIIPRISIVIIGVYNRQSEVSTAASAVSIEAGSSRRAFYIDRDSGSAAVTAGYAVICLGVAGGVLAEVVHLQRSARAQYLG